MIISGLNGCGCYGLLEVVIDSYRWWLVVIDSCRWL